MQALSWPRSALQGSLKLAHHLLVLQEKHRYIIPSKPLCFWAFDSPRAGDHFLAEVAMSCRDWVVRFDLLAKEACTEHELVVHVTDG